MITFKNGSIWNSKCEVIVVPVNCVGAMGKGLALECKQRHPWIDQPYKEFCKTEILDIGNPVTVFAIDGIVKPFPHLCLFPTKTHWKNPSHLSYIKEGLQSFCEHEDGKQYMSNYIRHKSAAFPKLGCGLGGLDWNVVKPIMIKYLGKLDMEIEIYE